MQKWAVKQQKNYILKPFRWQKNVLDLCISCWTQSCLYSMVCYIMYHIFLKMLKHLSLKGFYVYCCVGVSRGDKVRHTVIVSERKQSRTLKTKYYFIPQVFTQVHSCYKTTKHYTADPIKLQCLFRRHFPHLFQLHFPRLWTSVPLKAS